MVKIKPKTKKALAKRFKLTKHGKVKRHKAGKSHLMSHKTGKRVRQLRKATLVVGKTAKTYAYLLAPGK